LKNIINDNTSRLEYYDIFADEKSTSTAATDDNTSTIKWFLYNSQKRLNLLKSVIVIYGELNYAYNNNVDLGFVFWLYFLAERLSVFKK